MAKSELVEITGKKMMEKGKGLALDVGKVGKDGRTEWIWLPLSLVEDNQDGTFTMPEWLAKDKGLI